MSDKVKTWNSNIYPHLVKTMDNHYTVSGIACEVKKYLDRSIKSHNTTSNDNTYYTHRPQRLSRGNVSIKQKQPLRTSKQPLHSQQMNCTTPHIRDHDQAFRDRDHNPEPVIYKNSTRGHACFHGRNCPNCHLPLAHAHITATDVDTSSINIEEQDLWYEPFEVWWLVPRSSTLAITYSTSRDLPYSCPHSSILLLPLKTFSSKAMLDSECSTCIVQISQQPKESRKHVTHSDIHVKAIKSP